MSDPIHFKSDFIGTFTFFFMRIAYWFQSGIAKCFWWTFIFPALQFSKLLNAERNVPEEQRRTQSKTFVVLDMLIWHHKVFWSYLKGLFWINSRLCGMLNRYIAFKKLMGWNPSIPLMGFIEDKTTFTFELLFAYSEDGKSRGCDFTWLSRHNFHGTFQILSKELRQDGNKEKLFIKCIWLSGKDQGTTFEVTKLAGLDGRDKDQVFPSTIYYPPRPIIFMFEALISASALLAFFQLTKDGWTLVTKWIVQVWASVVEGVLFIANFLTGLM